LTDHDRVQQRQDSDVDDLTDLDVAEPDSPALRDAAILLARTEADEEAAAAARAQYETEGLPTLPTEESLAPELRGDEVLHARRSSAMLNRLDGAGTLPGYAGTLYLTSRRLIHIGHVTFTVPLTQIEEVSIVGERLLLTLSSGEGVSLDVAEPRLLRVMIGMARKTATR
jgi:hypothetical protein